MRNDKQDLIRVMGEAATFLESLSLRSGVMYKANLVLEEILTNIVKYAFPDRGVHDVSVDLAMNDEELVIRFVEDGCAFNPLSSPQPHLTESVLDCPVGGLGIYLVSKTVDWMDYRREQDKNILAIGLKLESAS